MPATFNNHIESLRGFLAIVVVIHHLSNLGKNIDPAFVPHNLDLWNLPGHIAVLVFFVLSGYLIGLTNKEQMSYEDVMPYLKKRAIRLYPIYALSIALVLIFINSRYPFTQIVANFTFMQVIAAPVINEILPAWSLHYEVFYYLLFIGVAFTKMKPITLMVLTIMVGMANGLFFPDVAITSSLSIGFCFWLAGLAIARYCTTKKQEHETNYSLLLSNLFLLLALDGYNILATIFHYATQFVFHTNFEYSASNYLFAQAIAINDLSLLPYCVIFVIMFAGVKLRYEKTILLTLQLLPLLTLKAILFSHGEKDLGVYLMPSIYYAISLLLFFTRAEKLNDVFRPLMQKMAFLGSISFAIYIIHHPIIELVKQIPFPSGSLLTYSLRVGFMVLTTIVVSYLLELKFQPWIKRLLVTSTTPRPIAEKRMDNISF